MDGALFKSCTLSELDNGRAQSFLFSFISLFSRFVGCASIGMSILAFTTNTNVVICSFTITPCVSQFLTTQKEGENGMSSIS
jgi:hypothetical protein